MFKRNSNLQVEPYGKVIDFSEWESIFKRIKKESPGLNFFDGEIDMSSTLLGVELESEDQSRLIVDQLLPNRGEILFKNQSHLLVRAQYYSAGLQHRISFTAVLLFERIIGKYPALEIAIVPPIKRISNLYISYPSEDKPVLLEIPVEGAPPEVRVVEISMEKMKAYNPGFKRVLPKTKKLEGMKLQFVDLGEVIVDGKVVKKTKKDIDIEFETISPDAHDVFDQYLTRDYLENNKPPADKHGFANEHGANAQEVINNWISYKNSESDELQVEAVNPATLYEKNALIVVKNDKLRDTVGNMICGLEYNLHEFKNFEDVEDSMYIDKDLLILDSMQNEDAAIDILQNLTASKTINKTPFIMVGHDRNDAREAEWEGLGKGIFIKSSFPSSWIENKIQVWHKEISNLFYDHNIEEENPSILVISDDENVEDLISGNLSSISYDIKYAHDRNTALHYSRNYSPNVIILDTDVKNSDGVDLLHVIRSYRTTQEIPVIMVSTSTDKVLIQQALDLGISDYLLKPIESITLLRRLQQILL